MIDSLDAALRFRLGDLDDEAITTLRLLPFRKAPAMQEVLRQWCSTACLG
jgi:hypothetical protein